MTITVWHEMGVCTGPQRPGELEGRVVYMAGETFPPRRPVIPALWDR